MANKQYISIIRLFEHCSISSDEELNLLRIKKHLNAEFDFAKTGFIEIDAYTYNKHDVFEEIEHQNFAIRLKYHKRIWKSKNLLSLLENNSVDLYNVKEELDQFQNDKDFDYFFSPYFAGPFNYISRALLNDLKFNELTILFQFEDFLQPEDRENGFRSVRVFLDDSLHSLKNVNKENYKKMRPKIIHWVTSNWDGFMNSLPYEFYEVKNGIVFHLINLTVKIQKSHRKDCRSISDELIALTDIHENYRETIYKNHNAYYKTSGVSEYRWVFWVAFVLIKILTMHGC